MSKYLYHVCYVVLLFLFFFGYLTPKNKQVSIQGNHYPTWKLDSAKSFTNKGKRFLKETSFHNFFHLINQYESQYPKESKVLLYDYAKEINKFIRYHSRQKDYTRLIHYYKNVKSIDIIPKNAQIKFVSSLIKALESIEYKSTALLLRKDYAYLANQINAALPTSTDSRFRPLKKWVPRPMTKKSAKIQMGIIKKISFSESELTGVWLNDRCVMTTLKHPFFEKVEDFSSLKLEVILPTGKKSALKYLGHDSFLETVFYQSALTNKAARALIDFVEFEKPVRVGETIDAYGIDEEGRLSSIKAKVFSASSHYFDAPDWIVLRDVLLKRDEGPMVINKNGHLIGIVAAIDLEKKRTLVLPIRNFLSIYDQIVHGRLLQRPWMGLKLVKLEGAREGLGIEHTFSTSPLALYGLTHHDRLLKINEIEIKNIAEAKKMVMGFDPGNPISILIETRDKKKKRYWFYLKERPHWPALTAVHTEAKLKSIWLSFGILLAQKNSKQLRLNLTGKRKKWTAYPVLNPGTKTLRTKQDIKEKDYLIILKDEYTHDQRLIEIMHVPQDMALKALEKNVRPFKLKLIKDKYDRYIL